MQGYYEDLVQVYLAGVTFNVENIQSQEDC